MADVFISYSRKDIQFAQRIHHELEARDREPWVDWQDIPPTSEWLDEVYAGIQAADTFLFIISPNSVVSEICTLEIEHAIQHNKRLVPVVLNDVEDGQVHSAMSAHNWVFLREEDDFEANFELLIDALDTDLEYVREHTRLLTLAIDWDENQRRRSAGLRGQELQTAEGWLAQSGSKDPQPTELHREYLISSRTAVDRLQRLIVSSVTVAFVLVLGLAAFSFYQRQQAVDAKNVAEARRQEAEKANRISKSQALAAFALAEMETNPELSLLLATESIRITRRVNGVVLSLSNIALRQSIIKSRVRLTLKGHDRPVQSAAYSPDGQRIVTGSWDYTAKVWDAQSGKELMTLIGHDRGVRSAAYSSDGQRIVTAGGKTAKVWEAQTGKELMTLKGHGSRVQSATYSPDGRRIVTAGDKTAKVWEAQTGQELMTLTGHAVMVTSVAYSADGQRIVTSGADRTAKIWDANIGQELITLTGHVGRSRVQSAAYSPDGRRIVTASFDKTAKVWEAQTGKELMTLKGHGSRVQSTAYSADGQRIVTGSADQTAKVWDAETGQELMTLTGHAVMVTSVAYSADGQRIVTAGGKTAKVWDANMGKELMTLKGHGSRVNSVAYGTGQRIVTGSFDKTAKVWDAVTGQELFTLIGHDEAVTSVAYSADGQRIVTASWDSTAKVWDAQTGQELFTLIGHDSWVASAAWSPNGQRIVTSGADDKTAKVWDAQTGQELLILKGHEGMVLSAVYSPDGQRIATSGADGIVQIYTTDMDELLQIAESRVTRQLTAEEKEKYGVLDLN